MSRLATALLLLALAAGCAPVDPASSDETPAPVDISLETSDGSDLESSFGPVPRSDAGSDAECSAPRWLGGASGLQVGDQVELDDGRVHVAVLDLVDSRCPKGAVCVWAGRVELDVRVRGGGLVGEFRLASDGPGIQIGDQELRLDEVTRLGPSDHGRAAPREITLGLYGDEPTTCTVVS